MNQLGVKTALADAIDKDGNLRFPNSKWKGQTLERQLQSDTHMIHAPKLKTRYVEHPVLGKVRIGFREVVRADYVAKASQMSESPFAARA